MSTALPEERIAAFARDGVLVVDIDEAQAWATLLRGALAPVVETREPPGPWQFWELHNPWSRAAARVDSWAVLDICQSAVLLDVVAALLGKDLVLSDSQIVPNPALRGAGGDWQDDTVFFPGTAEAGLVVRLPLCEDGAWRFDCDIAPAEDNGRERRIELQPGQLLLHRPALRYRCPAGPKALDGAFVIRYFAATELYRRDPQDPTQHALMERFPWINYAKMPLWLVRGEDHAGNDFVTGFHSVSGRWTAASTTGAAGD